MMFVRSLVLLGCLFGVPLIAIVGPAWPGDQVARLLGKPVMKADRASTPANDLNPPAHAPGASMNPDLRQPDANQTAGGSVQKTSALMSPGEPSFVPGQIPSRDQFSQLEQRLRELGASIYRLEVWGADENLYHFHCIVSRGTEQPVVFEETDSDPYRAVGRVVRQVEDWREMQRR